MTTVPSERAAWAPGSSTNASRNHAGDHGDGRHHDRRKSFARRFADPRGTVEAVAAAHVREVDQQDTFS